jgi:(2Fe-2S) ferredoxin
VRERLTEEITRQKLPVTIGSAKIACDGNCLNGPFLGFPSKNFFYLRVKPENVADVVEQTLKHGRIIFSHLSVKSERSYRPDIYYEKTGGLLMVIDDSLCMVEVAKYFLDFEAGLSCGKCVPCRQGLVRMNECMERIVNGKGTMADLEQVKILCEAMITTPHCEFAMTSSRPVLSAITHFRDEFVAHIEKQECLPGVCGTMARAAIA